MLRPLLAGMAALALASAQQQPPEEPEQVFRATVTEVIAPTVVTDRSGNFVDGLTALDFRLFDNGQPQDIKVDVSFIPISLVIAIQANDRVEAVLPKIQKIGPVIHGLITGEKGQVAVVAFDHRIQLKQDFTSDVNLISKALEKIKPGSTTSRLIDAATYSIRLLRNQPKDRRRVLLLIGETQDRGSEGKLRDAFTDAQMYNVSVYTVNINRLVTTLTAKPQPPRPDPFPPASRPLPPGVPATPTTTAQVSGGQGQSADFVPVIVEIFKATKAIFVDNPAEALTKWTGGREHAFVTQRDLEQAISDIGAELHSQYLLSYVPANRNEGGYHEIEVQVKGRRDVKVRTRPGYWIGGGPG